MHAREVRSREVRRSEGSASPSLAPATRLAAWYVTGPVGHLVAGALDIGELFARYLWLRARGRRIEWF